MPPPLLAFWAVGPLLYGVIRGDLPRPQLTTEMGHLSLGCLYVVLPFALLGLMDFLPGGKAWIFFLLAVVFATDTGAFYGGKIWGSRPLSPILSPKKTWEGAVVGWICGALLGLFFFKILHLGDVGPRGLLLASLLSLAAQTGDLAQSLIKRSHGVKDSGRILPGHGGILDRVDGLLFAVPLLYAILLASL